MTDRLLPPDFGDRVIGFTGTRNGMTDRQRESVSQIVAELKYDAGLHGDCIGADADFDAICKAAGMTTRCLPCTFENMRAHCTEAIAEPQPPMQRNREIVARSWVMIACPPNYERIKKGSGTWATIGFSERACKSLFIVFPDGTVSLENQADDPLSRIT